MKSVDEIENQRNKKKEAELRKFMYQLDTVGEILYNNLDYDGVWEVIENFEELRIRYYVLHHEYEEKMKEV